MKYDKTIGPIPYALGVLVVALALSVAWALAYWKSLQSLEDQTRHLASEVLARGQAVSVQFDNTALKALLAHPSRDPCSPDSIEMMRRLAINARSLRLIGHVSNNRLMCSSYGSHGEGIPMGPPDHVSKNGFELRSAVALPIAGNNRFVSTTHGQSGFTAFIVPGLMSDLMAGASAGSFGVFGATTRRLTVSRGAFRMTEAWLAEPLEAGASRVFQGAGHLVVVQRSAQFDYAVYAALPLSEMQDELATNALILAPLALVSGLALAALIVVQAKRRQSLANRLRQALRRDELFLVYQPIVELASGRWSGAEALARWRLPNGTLVPPDVFVAVAEKHGLIQDLTARVIELFGRDVAQLHRRHPGFHFSINFSAHDFAGACSVERLRHALAAGGIATGQVTVEITERALIQANEVRDSIRKLRELGTHIAIDDFGTGYSGLSYLTMLELDALKIDKVFVDTIGTDAVTKNVITHIIEIGKSMGLRMVAEGVETQAQASYLRAQGVTHAQGWLYAKALPLAELRRRLDRDALDPPPDGGATPQDRPTA
ncbi:EAL domain-containing protein [Hydrogenophaga sp. OTU3427]|uniref:EAL domain-containing protein n=1 Tax=Hydrogenophaga sp. OTU3427 TaxID=3043856 RepID=UPI00313AFBDD